MQVLVLNSIGGRLDQLQKVLTRARTASLGAVFVVGSLAAARRPDTPPHDAAVYEPLLDTLASLGLPIYIAPGVDDAPLPVLGRILQSYRNSINLFLVHRAAAYLGDGDVVAGFGGQLTADETALPDGWHFPGWELRITFEHLAAFNAQFQMAQRRVLLLGTPPRGHHVDRDGEQSVGFQVVNGVLRTYQPHLVCCAGPPSGRGVEHIETTPVVNPGLVADGCYALINMADLSVRLERLHEPLAAGVGAIGSVLVALDSSAEAWRALETAAGIARSFAARVTLLHAFEHVNSALGRPYDQATVTQRMRQGEELLEEAAEYLADLEPQLELLEGPAADAIVRVAEVQHVDLIVMGARGHGGLRALLGSVSQRVLKRAPCSVLVTRQRPLSPELVEHRQ